MQGLDLVLVGTSSARANNLRGSATSTAADRVSSKDETLSLHEALLERRSLAARFASSEVGSREGPASSTQELGTNEAFPLPCSMVIPRSRRHFSLIRAEWNSASSGTTHMRSLKLCSPKKMVVSITTCDTTSPRPTP